MVRMATAKHVSGVCAVAMMMAAGCLLRAVPAAGAVSVSVPLGGYHRPGRYMPLEVDVALERASTGAVLIIEAENAVPVRVRLADGRASGIVPFLPLAPLRQVRWRAVSGDGAEIAAGLVGARWQPLGLDEAFVGYVSADFRAASFLFPGREITGARLDERELFAGPAEAWETLDAVVLDEFPRLDARKVPALMAAGVVLVARGVERPDSHWPWKRAGGMWVLRAETRGPRLAGDDPAAFVPVDGWSAGWPARFRQHVVLYAAAFSILIVAATLLRSGRAVPLIVLIVAGMSGGVALWHRNQSPVLQHGGIVTVIGDGFQQHDRWFYRTSAERCFDAVPFLAGMRPFVESRRLTELMSLALVCDERGMPLRYEYRLWPGVKLAFLSRTVNDAGGTPAATENTPMLLLARRAYLRRGDVLRASVAEIPHDPAASLGAVFIRAAQ